MSHKDGKTAHNSLSIHEGMKGSHDGRKVSARAKFKKRNQNIDIQTLAKEIKKGSKRELAQGITLIESRNPQHQYQAQLLLQTLMQHESNSIRIGISGVPGAGKSTFIDIFGMMLCEMGHKVAVLAIDPSSTVTGGSILGDKTRMEKLANHPNAYVRPSPTSGTLGGVHRKTRETMQLCEAAGYDVILIETVGVGQSEVAVRNMVDFFMLLVLTGAGDELQGMKKGIMEMTDLIIVHKADGENIKTAKRTMREYKRLLHFLQPATENWETTAILVSSIANTGHDDIWKKIETFRAKMQDTGIWEERRQQQLKNWFTDMLHEAIIDQFFHLPEKRNQAQELGKMIEEGNITVRHAVNQMLSKNKP